MLRCTICKLDNSLLMYDQRFASSSFAVFFLISGRNIQKIMEHNIRRQEYDKDKSCKYCVNHTIYKSVISPQETLDIVLLITSSHREDAVARRETIRSTWGNDSYYLPHRIKHVFVFGKSSIRVLHN